MNACTCIFEKSSSDKEGDKLNKEQLELFATDAVNKNCVILYYRYYWVSGCSVMYERMHSKMLILRPLSASWNKENSCDLVDISGVGGWCHDLVLFTALFSDGGQVLTNKVAPALTRLRVKDVVERVNVKKS